MVGSALVIMGKAPVPGEVKTRLCPPLTPDSAAEFYSCLLHDKITQACRVHDASVYLALPGPAAGMQSPCLPPGCRIIEQRGSDLGERLCGCAADAFGMGYRRVLLVDSDTPTLPPSYFSRALSMLQENPEQTVLGPTRDGGYYLIGLSSPCAELFEDIPWSTQHVLASTLERAESLRMHAALLPEWYDIDTEPDLDRLMVELQDPAVAAAAPRTAAWLAQWRMRE